MNFGNFIVLEGIDGCGKSTQLQRLVNWLPHSSLLQPGQVIVATREPGDTALGQALRSLLLTQDWADQPLQPMAELLLYAADRAQHVETVLRPQLAAGAVVVCDRYVDSTVAYQGYGRGLDQSAIAQLNALATAGLRSDLTLWLDLPVAIAAERCQARGQGDRMEAAGLAFQERLRQGFQAIAAAEPDRVVRIDAAGDPDQVAARIQAVVQQRWPR
ncbi:dTMP kinase [Synechococcus elongatus]|uniref:Thymidylate kinase n=1 Tax=Synechococcus elongatus (strain ATCC 33912 / PCC 7942 / FACHB-805) TaxID=1140 RepID=Q31S44_SYNE7|nr:dTMP kinase [Synechococcus elongatus]ABB56125.1 thymidylate kinase [Synechococcus elongatus PCC 7942 = FACHB-805]AJD56818.1 thymidylate kinase [Synechococcus elongatus UTEX 2973]MBD2587957.1 dTMP kinase [Synechococcus elongatus FACHB-242]MBD2689025.1 dTMP kinase [Synechococcus elongatus FACHB-1061]MBD2707335.1 dTMP kinase [Synechococcus elongatus PCC 7942 = FACHB-805]